MMQLAETGVHPIRNLIIFATENQVQSTVCQQKIKTMKRFINLFVLLMTLPVIESSGATLEWNYDTTSDTYYIVGLVYCDQPADESYEQMGIFVPGAYMTAQKNSNGTYSCTLNTEGVKNGFTAATAPIVMPVNTAGYKAMSPPSGYSSKAKSYTDQGFIYLHAGCRGKDAAAPSAITDLKSAIKYYRYLAAQGAVPGHTDRIFAFGHSGGGAQTAILGTCGNSSLYDDYLKELGAKTDYRDDIAGSMCWCPITNLDLGSEGYEWNMGQTRSGLTEADQQISKALAAAFADYINSLQLKHPMTGQVLTLSATDDGYYQRGTYYEYVMEMINDAISRYNTYNQGSVAAYDPTDSGALAAFAQSNKKATKGLGAFDNYSKGRTSAGNQLFDPDGVWAHFDKRLAEIVGKYAPTYKSDFDADLVKVDRFGHDLDWRVAMYTPMYYLISNSTYYDGGGKGSSQVAPHWRIRTGIKQGDTSLCTEINLALALKAYGIEDVDFATIWGQGHTQAEDTGNGTDNFIVWVMECCGADESAINAVKASSQKSEPFYHLSGRKEGRPSRGMYVHRNRVVMIR